MKAWHPRARGGKGKNGIFGEQRSTNEYREGKKCPPPSDKDAHQRFIQNGIVEKGAKDGEKNSFRSSAGKGLAQRKNSPSHRTLMSVKEEWRANGKIQR